METFSVQSMSIVTADTQRIERWRFGPLFSRSRNATIMNHNVPSHRASAENLQPWYKRINVEPTILICSFVFGLLIPITSLFLFFARCVEIFADRTPNGDYGDIRNATQFCMEIQHSNNTKAINEVDADVATLRIYTQLGNTLATICMAPIIGAWADYAGRRKPFLMVLVGIEIYVIAQTLGVYFYDKINVFYFFLTGEIFVGLCGGVGSLMALSLSIVSDDARADHSFTPSSVPLRVIIACAGQSVGILLGTATTSLVEMLEYDTAKDKINGYLLIFTVSSVLTTIAFIYTFFFMKDTYKTVLEMNEQTAIVLGLEPTEPAIRKSLFGSVVDSVGGVIRVASMRRPGFNRLCLNLCVLFVLVEFFAYDTQITCLFVKRPPFEWSDSLFANFMLARFVFTSLGMIIVPTFIRKTSLVGKESYMIIFGLASGVISNLVFGFSKTTAMVFATIPFSFFGGAIQTGYRALLPKLVPQEQTARLFSLVAMVLVICPMISALSLNNIYKSSIDWWPGFVFIIQAALFTVIFFGQILVHVLLRPLWQRESMFDGTETLLPNPYDQEEEENDNEPFGLQHRDTERSISEEAVHSSDDGHPQR